MALLAAVRLADARREQGYQPLTESFTLPVLKAVLSAARGDSLCSHAAATALSRMRGVRHVGEAASDLSKRPKVPLFTGCPEPAYPPTDMGCTYSRFLEAGDEYGNFNSWFCSRYCQGDLLLGRVKYKDPRLWTCVLCAQQAVSDGGKPASIHLSTAFEELERRLPDIACLLERPCHCADQGLVAPEAGASSATAYHTDGDLVYDTFLKDRLPPGQLTSSLHDSIAMEAVGGGHIKVSKEDVAVSEAEVTLAEAQAAHAGFTLDTTVHGEKLYVGRSPVGVCGRHLKRKRGVDGEGSSSDGAQAVWS
jgi:hypothetical protein